MQHLLFLILSPKTRMLHLKETKEVIIEVSERIGMETQKVQLHQGEGVCGVGDRSGRLLF